MMGKQWSVVSGQWSVTGGCRRGISLLEVLICIGIVAIGLVSIAALLPVGGVQVQKANTQERKASLGLNAFREFQVRGMDNVQNWVRYNSPNWVSYLPLTLTAPSVYQDFPYLPPVAIDPLMAAVGQSQGTSAAAAISTFPANYSSGPLMGRLAIKSSASFSSPNYIPTRSLADAVFVAADDVMTEVPGDVSQPGTGGIIYSDPPTNTVPLKRDYQGSFTWLATITPNFPNRVLPGPPNSPNAISPPQLTDQYTLSIVVFDRRILSTPVPATDEQGQEEMVSATSATPAAVSVSGGEFMLSDDNSAHPSNPNASGKLGMVRPDQWIMLCRYVPYPYDPNNVLTTPYFPLLEAKWYRVVTAGNITQSGSIYSRQVTLAGPDWEPTPTAPALMTWPVTIPLGSQNYNTYACIFDGAVAVYQRVIHLEGPSVWNQ